jgi:hypothetical protein
MKMKVWVGISWGISWSQFSGKTKERKGVMEKEGLEEENEGLEREDEDEGY